MIKTLRFTFLLLLISYVGNAQITITSSDMPVMGDTLRHSMANPVAANINLNNTGANIAWDFSSLTPIAQSVDTYRSASQVNLTYAFTISPTAYGYKVSDSLFSGGGTIPVSVNDVYTFFGIKSNPSRFVAEAFAAKISGFPTPINYSDEDEYYFFPLAFSDVDSSTYKLSYSLMGLGSFSISGSRVTTVDGWGTIKTPHFTTAVNVIRVRSEMTEVDSLTFSGTSLGIPRHSVTYNWLANVQHDPVLTVVTEIVGNTETPITVRFHDHKRSGLLSIPSVKTGATELITYPNPATEGFVHLNIPNGWQHYTVEVYDMTGKLITTGVGVKVIATDNLSQGQYLLRVINADNIAWGKFSVQ